jgi:hypothetical protein
MGNGDLWYNIPEFFLHGIFREQPFCTTRKKMPAFGKAGMQV